MNETNSPLVSIIIPVYNGERYLNAALKSVFCQNYRSIEVIAVDDGSTDVSAAIVKAYREISYVYQSNQGPSAARNTGIKKAKGEFLSFIDQDDLWMKNKLRLQITYLQKHPDLDFVFAHRRTQLEDNTPVPPWYKEHLFENDVPLLLASGLLARKTVFEKVGLYNPNYHFGENAEWMARAKDKGVRMAILPETLIIKRVHGRNQTYHLDEMRSDVIRALKASIDRKRKIRSFEDAHHDKKNQEA